MKASTIYSFIKNTLSKMAFRRYTFFDANNVPFWALKYLFLFRENWIELYEKRVSEFFGAPSFCLGSGRMSLYILLKLFGIKDGDEVILPGYNCVVCPNAVIYTGAKPVYADIDKASFSMSSTEVEKKITPKTKAIVIQYTYGIAADPGEILRVAEKHRIPVIEDCAHALGGEYKGKKLGTFGDASFFSSDHTKVISTGLGGGIVLNNGAYLDTLKRILAPLPEMTLVCRAKVYLQYIVNGILARPCINWFGRYVMILYDFLRLSFYFYDENITRKEDIKGYSYPVRMSRFQAYFGYREFRRLEANIRHRSSVVEALKTIFDVSYNNGPILMYPLVVRDPGRWKKLFDNHVEIFDWFSNVIFGRTKGPGGVYYKKGMCPRAEYIAAHIITFPTNFFVDKKALSMIRAIADKHALSAEVCGGGSGQCLR